MPLRASSNARAKLNVAHSILTLLVFRQQEYDYGQWMITM
jgi:hypothetical protein